MRGSILAALVGLAAVAFLPADALAGEPLFLRIRPQAQDAALGQPSAQLTDDEIAAAARARREAVWQRSDRRARLAIASICTGCLKAPEPAITAPSSAGPETSARTRPASVPTPDDPDPASDASTSDAGAAPLSLADSR